MLSPRCRRCPGQAARDNHRKRSARNKEGKTDHGTGYVDRRGEGIAPRGQKAASPPRPAVINRPTTKTPPGPKQLLGFVCPEISCHSFALSDRFRRAHQDHLGYGHAPNRRCRRPGPRVPRRSLHAIHLCTLAGAQLHGDAEHLDSLRPGCLADLVAFQGDPMTCALRALPEMRPKLTIVGGRVASDLEGLGSAPEPCKSILPHNARLNRRALGNRFMLALVGGGEGR